MRKWLAEEPEFKQSLLAMAAIILGYLIWSYVVTSVYSAIGCMDTLVANNPNATLQVGWLVWLTMIPLVLGEEIFFRLPLSFAARFLERWPRLRDAKLIGLTIFLSVLFGWAHAGWLSVPLQGMLGVVFSIFYLKHGGYSGKFWKPLMLCWLLHVLLNSTLFGLDLISRYLVDQNLPVVM